MVTRTLLSVALHWHCLS